MKKLFYISFFVLIIVLIMALIPINTSKENSVIVTGIVKQISKDGVNDLVFELQNDKITYYINRGLENGFNLVESRKKYLGKKVILSYAKNWTPLAPLGTTSKHITQISIDGKEIYSEWN